MADQIASKQEADVVFARVPRLVQRSGLSRSTIYQLIKAGKLPKPHRLPGSKIAIFDVAEFDAALRRLLAQGSEPEPALP